MTSTQQPEGSQGGPASHPVVGFIPWILFWVIGGPASWETASIAALLAALLVLALSIGVQPLAAWSAGREQDGGARLVLRHIKLLDVATVVFFVAMTIAAVVTSRHDVAELDRYSQAIASGALAIIALGSIVAGHPFTVDYAREQAPPEVWHTAAFKRINLVLSATWTAVFAVCAVLGWVAQQGAAKGVRDWLNWYIPIIVVFLAFRFTSWYPDQVRAAQQDQAGVQR